ncbi:hypothetical protein ACYFX5_22740 [Bremerella sp. T1]|uniref:hypothetical protein n=1 Tax=Bremerella sp. TYQ1 TaxID=3119568 RepID=UPI001CCC7FE8|nr:hypothetical protein [Bremerella volcania]UBM35852.1 hypothetical protein LA756_24685 [Bremerella volcania]
MKRFSPVAIGLVLLTAFAVVAEDKPAEKKASETISFGEGHLEMDAPEGWKSVKPRVGIIDVEMQVPAAKGDETAGRVTLMGAGGSIDANIDRWKGQFVKMTKEASVKEVTIADQKVHIVELVGDFKDQRGPFAPAEVKEGYTMLAAIITTDKLGNYFLKFYGPSTTVDANKEKFMEMVKSLKVKKAAS